MPTNTAPILARYPLQRRAHPSLLGAILKALAIWRERRHLAGLDDHILQDLGLTRSDVEMETKRPVWDAPNRWLR